MRKQAKAGTELRLAVLRELHEEQFIDIDKLCTHTEEWLGALAEKWGVPMLELASILGLGTRPEFAHSTEWVDWRRRVEG
jgi:hypothetical protein